MSSSENKKSGIWYKIILEYDGTDFCGWQIQNSSIPNTKTLQDSLNQALYKIGQGKEVYTLASGRTDAGVHALGQVVKIGLTHPLPVTAMLNGLNSHLHPQIRVVSAEITEEKFHPIRDALWKEYHYYFTFGPVSPGVHCADKIGHCPHELNLNKILEGLKIFEGEHDFVNYRCTGSDTNSTIRQIFQMELEEINSMIGFGPKKVWRIKLRGNGFLKQMVRLIIGALWNLGKEKISITQIKESLEGSIETRLGPVAPATGLYLYKVGY